MAVRTKRALILGDGGIKGGFVAGAAGALVAAHGESLEQFDYMMASSASAGNLLYYLSYGEDHPGEQMWTELLGSDRFVTYSGALDLWSKDRLYDIDYMVDEIFRKEVPLNIERLRETKIVFYIPVQDYSSGALVYFSNAQPREFYRGKKKIEIKDFFSIDPYDLIKAASAPPFVYDIPVVLDGRKYIDAAAIEPFALDLPGFDQAKIIALFARKKPTLGKALSYVLSGIAWPVFVNPFRKSAFRARVYWDYALKPFRLRRLMDRLKDLEANDHAVIVQPNGPLGGSLDNSKETLRKNYDAGVAAFDAKAKSIERLLATE